MEIGIDGSRTNYGGSVIAAGSTAAGSMGVSYSSSSLFSPLTVFVVIGVVEKSPSGPLCSSIFMFYVRDEGQSGPDGLFPTTPMTKKTVKGENK